MGMVMLSLHTFTGLSSLEAPQPGTFGDARLGSTNYQHSLRKAQTASTISVYAPTKVWAQASIA